MHPRLLTAAACLIALRIRPVTTRRRLRSARGVGVVEVVVVVAVLGLVGWLAKPRLLDGESRRADASAAASAQVETAVARAVAAEQAKGATVAASVQQIGLAAAAADPSPHTDYIIRESAWVAPLLPSPDAAAQLAAERRRLAMVEGRLDEARRLYATADKDRAALLARAERAEGATAKAFAARRQADAALAEAAAANLALKRRSAQQWLTIGALVILAVFLWLNGISPAKIGRAMADIRAGTSPAAAFDTVLPEWIQSRVNRAARLATPPADPKQ